MKEELCEEIRVWICEVMKRPKLLSKVSVWVELSAVKHGHARCHVLKIAVTWEVSVAAASQNARALKSDVKRWRCVFAWQLHCITVIVKMNHWVVEAAASIKYIMYIHHCHWSSLCRVRLQPSNSSCLATPSLTRPPTCNFALQRIIAQRAITLCQRLEESQHD